MWLYTIYFISPSADNIHNILTTALWDRNSHYPAPVSQLVSRKAWPQTHIQDQGVFLLILYPVQDLVYCFSNNGHFLLNFYISFKFNYATLCNLEVKLVLFFLEFVSYLIS